jgi:predicted GIY-YIG superfamily endonuclease
VTATALYRLYDSAGELLYIGVTSNPQVRWGQHKSEKPWWPQVARKTLEWLPTRDEALDAEPRAIVSERPRYNKQHALPHVSEEAAILFATVKETRDELRRLWPQAKEIAIREMRAGATVGQLAEWTGYNVEKFRRIAREAGIERRRPPTRGQGSDLSN